jgi:endoglucanase
METELSSISSETKRDILGSIAFRIGDSSRKPSILLVGHLDEIGFMVHSILKSGLIKFTNLGGWDPRTLMSSPVEIHNSKGEKITGLIGSTPVHHLGGGGDAKLSIDDLFIDIGADSDEEVYKLFGVKKGDFIVPIPHYHYIKKKNCMMSKAFDDRVGIAVAIETGKHFATKKHPNTLYVAGSAQEEVGTRGAQTIANLIKPDIAIIIEGAPGDDFPSNRDESQAKKNSGVQIRLIDPTMIAHRGLSQFVIDIAEKQKIPYQIAIRKSGGTDAGKIHLSNIGVPCVVLAAPVRYAHSHNGILSMSDYQATLDLAKAIVEKLDEKAYKKIVE